MKKSMYALTALCLTLTSTAHAKPVATNSDLSAFIKTPNQLQWGTPKLFDKGAHDSMLYSSPNGGPYTVRIKFPSNFVVQPFYSSGPIHITVLAGTLHINSGTTFSTAKPNYALPAGSFFTIPTNTAIYMWTKEASTTIQMHADKVSTITKIKAGSAT